MAKVTCSTACADRVVEVGGGEAGRWRDDGVGVVGVDAVEADQGVEVDRAACLELGGFAVGQPDRRDRADVAGGGDDLDAGDAAAAGEFGQVAFRGLLGAVPQLAGVEVPDDLVVVVVAVQAQRLPEYRVAGLVARPADGGSAVCAEAGGVARRAWQGSARQSQRRRLPQVCRLTARTCTVPKDGAVNVANTAGCCATRCSRSASTPTSRD